MLKAFISRGGQQDTCCSEASTKATQLVFDVDVLFLTGSVRGLPQEVLRGREVTPALWNQEPTVLL